MTIFELRPDSGNFNTFGFADDVDGANYRSFDGLPIGDRWKPVKVEIVDTDDELAQLADYALLGIIPLFSERAADALRKVLEMNGELLPVTYSRRPYFAYNVTTFVDALDEANSELLRFPDGRVMAVSKYVFREAALTNATVFKIPQFRRAYVFATEAFVKRVRDEKLTGFLFKELWSVPLSG